MPVKKVLVFGSFDRKQNVNSSRIEALKSVGIEVLECSSDFLAFNRVDPKSYSILSMLWFAIKYFFHTLILCVHFFSFKNFDAILVFHPGYVDVFFAKVLGKISGKKVFFFPLVSVYQTLVFQRKYFDQNSLQAKIFFRLDKLSCSITDVVVLDTNAHIDFFSKAFKLPKQKFSQVFIGADSVFFPQKPSEKQKEFEVLFYGSFIPGQALEKIVEAADILRERGVFFRLVGRGPLFEKVRGLVEKKKLKNLKLMGFVAKELLPKFIAQADVGLGLLEDNEKTNLVVGNKVYELIAMKKAVVNFDCIGIKELLEDKKSVLLVQSDPQSIAQGILLLKKNVTLRKKLAENAIVAFEQNCSSIAIGQRLRRIISKAL